MKVSWCIHQYNKKETFCINAIENVLSTTCDGTKIPFGLIPWMLIDDCLMRKMSWDTCSRMSLLVFTRDIQHDENNKHYNLQIVLYQWYHFTECPRTKTIDENKMWCKGTFHIVFVSWFWKYYNDDLFMMRAKFIDWNKEKRKGRKSQQCLFEWGEDVEYLKESFQIVFVLGTRLHA